MVTDGGAAKQENNTCPRWEPEFTCRSDAPEDGSASGAEAEKRVGGSGAPEGLLERRGEGERLRLGLESGGEEELC